MSEKYKFVDKHGVYFVTPTLVGWVDLFTKKQYIDIILDSLRFCQKEKGLVIHAWVVMSSHLHLIISSNKNNLSDIMRDFKTYTSKQLIQELLHGNDSRKEWMVELFRQAATPIKRVNGYKVWQDGNHPVLLDSNQKFNDRLNYLHNNPVEQIWLIIRSTTGIRAPEITWVVKDYSQQIFWSEESHALKAHQKRRTGQ